MKYLREYIGGRKGNAMGLTMIMVPTVLILTGLVIDGGMLFVKKAQLQSIADSAVNAGISVTGDEIVDIVEAMAAEDPEFEVPENIVDALSDDDRAVLAASTGPAQTAENYIDLNNYDNLALSPEDVIFPYNYTVGDDTLSMKIELGTVHELYFGSMLGIETQFISAESMSFITID